LLMKVGNRTFSLETAALRPGRSLQAFRTLPES